MSCWDEKQDGRALTDALAVLAWTEVDRLVGKLVHCLQAGGLVLSEEMARAHLTALRRKRRFAPMLRLAEALFAAGQSSFRVRQDHAQGLLDLGRLAEARARLHPLVAETLESARDARLTPDARAMASYVHFQARGLIGRSYKQAYVDADAPQVEENRVALGHAVSAYWEVYAQDRGAADRRWHGVNAVTLALRGRRDGVPLELGFEPEAVADALISAVREAERGLAATAWDFATAMEACLARPERAQEAVHWAEKYVAVSGLDAFEIASTLRQVEEVCQVPLGSTPGDEVHALLRARLMGLQGGAFEVDPRAARRVRSRPSASGPMEAQVATLERAYEWLLARTQCIARIERYAHLGVGTGVVVRGGDLHPTFGDEPLLLTNAHVVSAPPLRWASAARASEVQVAFEFSPTPGAAPFRTRVREVLWQSAPSDLDACVSRLVDPLPAGREPFRVAHGAPTIERDQPILLAGYPLGGALALSVAVTSNVVVDQGHGLLHYRADTQKGSSGSPVFDQERSLLALHRQGRALRPRLGAAGVHTASEGALLSAIRDAMQQELRT